MKEESCPWSLEMAACANGNSSTKRMESVGPTPPFLSLSLFLISLTESQRNSNHTACGFRDPILQCVRVCVGGTLWLPWKERKRKTKKGGYNASVQSTNHIHKKQRIIL